MQDTSEVRNVYYEELYMVSQCIFNSLFYYFSGEKY